MQCTSPPPSCPAVDVSTKGAAPPAPSPDSGFAPCAECGELAKSCAHRLLPNPRQIPFLQSAAFEALYGGGKGSGKTRALVLAALYWVGHPRFRGLLLRREWKQAARTLLAEAKRIYPAFGAIWLAGAHVWRFPSGAEIEINGCDNAVDVERYFGTPELSYLGIDQLEHFTREMYLALISCVRSAAGLPLVVRATANPGGIGLDWLVERFAPWVQPPPGDPWYDARYTGPRVASEAVLFFRTTAGEHGTEIVCERDAHEHDCERERVRVQYASTQPPCAPGRPCTLHAPRSRQYVHAVVSDNPFTAGTAYETNLMSLDPVERAWYLSGNWMVRARAGAYFTREWIPVVQAAPAAALVRVRYWDRAATKGDPRAAFTAGVRLALLASGLILVEHVERGQWDPGEVDEKILATADRDPPGTVLAIETDGGQAGKSQAYYDARMLAGRDFVLRPPIADKVTRMKPFSAQCRARNVAVLAGTWTGEYFRELESCPLGKWDQIDSSSGGLFLLLELQEKLELMRRSIAHRAAAVRATGAQRPATIDGGSTSMGRW
jgi:phage terminase large subunit-like protein